MDTQLYTDPIYNRACIFVAFTSGTLALPVIDRLVHGGGGGGAIEWEKTTMKQI